jgi:hypothetical protein
VLFGKPVKAASTWQTRVLGLTSDVATYYVQVIVTDGSTMAMAALRAEDMLDFGALSTLAASCMGMNASGALWSNESMASSASSNDGSLPVVPMFHLATEDMFASTFDNVEAGASSWPEPP